MATLTEEEEDNIYIEMGDRQQAENDMNKLLKATDVRLIHHQPHVHQFHIGAERFITVGRPYTPDVPSYGQAVHDVSGNITFFDNTSMCFSPEMFSQEDLQMILDKRNAWREE